MNKKNFKNFDFCSQVSAFLIENYSMLDASAFAVLLRRRLRRNQLRRTSDTRFSLSLRGLPSRPWQSLKMRSGTIIKAKTSALTLRSQKVFEEDVNLLIRFWSWRMTLAVGHGNLIRMPEKPVDCNRMIKGFPSLSPIFRAA